MPNANQVEFSTTYFLKTLVLERCAMIGRTSFRSSHFARMAFFQSSFFEGIADFDVAHFTSNTSFHATQFAEAALFNGAHFAATASFSVAQFARRVEFQSAIFSHDTDFVATRFLDHSFFGSAGFMQSAFYNSAQFEGGSNFRFANFNSVTSFDDGRFNAQAAFGGVKFSRFVPSFFQCTMHDNTTFTLSSVYWPDVPKDKRDAESDKEAYRRLRQVSANQHNPEAEHFFLRQEMACDAILKEDWLSRFVVRAFGVFSSYGYSVWRPIAGLLATWGIGALLIQIVFAWAIVYGTPPRGMTEVPGLMDALGLGLANTFAIFGFRSYYLGEAYMIALPVLVKLIGGVQTVLGFIFLFFLGLGLRNRFRLK